MRSILSLVVGCAILSVIVAHERQEQIPPNRCLPGQSCFPTRAILAEFAATLTGSLVQPFDATYRSFVSMANNRLTRHPYIIVVAGDVGDVQKAMKFARKYQLMVTAQYSTDDMSGRSSYDGGLQINLSRMTAITKVVDTSERSEYGEITAQSATSWDSVYTQARTIQRDVVASSDINYPVGLSVGDGGIGPLVKVYGLVGDNLLEAKMVTADGNLVTVTEYAVEVDYGDGLVRRSYDRTLFSAITGGGIGPWGVVVSYTFKLYPAPASIVHVVARYKIWESGTYVGEDILNFLTGIISFLPEKWGGYIYIDGSTSSSLVASKGELVANLFYYGVYGSDPDYFFVDGILNFQAADSLLDVTVTNRSSIQDYERLQGSVPTGRYYTFNHLLQLDKVTKLDDGNEKLVNALLFSLNNPTIESSFNCFINLMGGASQVETRNYSLVNPALRSAFGNLGCSLTYEGRGLDDSYYIDHALDFAAMFDEFSEGKLRTYGQDLSDWKKQYHGVKYGGLIDTKIKYDIDNFLWCHNCVGSDFRVDCRYNDNHRGLMLSGYVTAQRAGRGMRERKERDHDHDTRHPYVDHMSHD